MLKIKKITIDQESQKVKSIRTALSLKPRDKRTRGTILVIESEKLICNWLRWVLHCRGYEVLIAATAEEAEAQICRTDADQLHLVIADVHLRQASPDKEMAGYQLYQRWTQAYSNVPFLLITEQTGDQELVDVKEGKVPLLVKRFLIADLMEAVRHACRCQLSVFDPSTRGALSA